VPTVTFAIPPSKRVVNRAGDHLASLYAHMMTGHASGVDEMTDDELAEFVESLRLVEWWRQQHA
jgi:hypothetical protein